MLKQINLQANFIKEQKYFAFVNSRERLKVVQKKLFQKAKLHEPLRRVQFQPFEKLTSAN